MKVLPPWSERQEIRYLEEKLKKAEAEAQDWRESWEETIGKIGDLIHKVRQRPKGRRFATVIDLSALLRDSGTR